MFLFKLKFASTQFLSVPLPHFNHSQLKKPAPKVRNPEDDVRSDLLKAIRFRFLLFKSWSHCTLPRDGIALKKTEAKEAQENKQGQVMLILLRMVLYSWSNMFCGLWLNTALQGSLWCGNHPGSESGRWVFWLGRWSFGFRVWLWWLG